MTTYNELPKAVQQEAFSDLIENDLGDLVRMVIEGMKFDVDEWLDHIKNDPELHEHYPATMKYVVEQLQP